MDRLGEESCSCIRLMIGRCAFPYSRSYLDISRTHFVLKSNDIPVLELSNYFSPIPFLIKQGRLRLDLARDLPKDLTPVIIDPFLIDQNTSVPLYDGKCVVAI
jgi:hypothetical protein